MEAADSFDVLYNALLIEDEDKRIQTLRTLIDSGVDVNSCWNGGITSMMRYESEGLTVLMVAAWNGYVDCVQVILNAGANVNQSDKRGQTVLIVAAGNGYDKCVKLLIDAGANVNQSDKIGQTVLMVAAFNGGDKCVKLLIDAGANVNQSDKIGTTVLIKSFRHVQCLRLLLEAGADVDQSNKIGETALIITAKAGSVECMELLLKAGSDVNGLNTNGSTALILCLKSYNNSKVKACLKLLINAGADIDVQNNKNLQPIHFAFMRWRHDTFPVEYLISENCNLNQASYDQVKVCIDEDRFGTSFKLDDRLDMLELLFACGLPRHLCQSFIVEQDTSVRNWVETVASQPNTLKSICIFKIRRSLGHGIKSKVTKLNLPNVIQNLILLKQFLSFECFN